MAAPKNNTVYALLAKIEATYLTFNTPSAATDGIQVAELPTVQPAYGFDGMRPSIPGGAGQQIRVPPQGRIYGLSPVKIENRGSGAAYSASVFAKDKHVFLRASGFDAAFSGGVGTEKITYTPTLITAVPAALSLEAYLEATTGGNAEKWQGTGVYCDAEYNIENGAPGMWTFTPSGRSNALPSEVSFPSVTYSATPVPPVASPMVLSVNAVTSLICRSLNLKLQRTIQARYADQNQAAAHAGFAVGERKPVVSFLVEAPLFATQNYWSLWDVGTVFAMSWQTGATQYNRTKFTCAQAQVINAVPSSDGPVPLLTVTASLHNSTPAANDDLVIVDD